MIDRNNNKRIFCIIGDINDINAVIIYNGINR